MLEEWSVHCIVPENTQLLLSYTLFTQLGSDQAWSIAVTSALVTSSFNISKVQLCGLVDNELFFTLKPLSNRRNEILRAFHYSIAMADVQTSSTTLTCPFL